MDKTTELSSNIKVKSAQYYLERLNSIYGKLPKFDCGDCSDCVDLCIRPITFLVEFENIFRFIDANLSQEERTRVIKDIVIMYHGGALYKQVKDEFVGGKCVFRDNLLNKCIIYPVRPMACRIFGLKGLRHNDPICQFCKRDCQRIRIIDNQDFDCSMITSLYDQIAELSRLFKGAAIDEMCSLPLSVHILEIWMSLRYIDFEQAKKEFGGLDHKKLLEIALKDPCLKNRRSPNTPRYYGEWKNPTV